MSAEEDEYSSSSASFDSPETSENEGDDDDDDEDLFGDGLDEEGALFAMPPLPGSSQDESTGGKFSPGFATQPSKTQPSPQTPAEMTTETATAATTTEGKTQKRGMPGSPTDSLAHLDSNKKRRTSPRKSPSKVIGVEENNTNVSSTHTPMNLAADMEAPAPEVHAEEKIDNDISQAAASKENNNPKAGEEPSSTGKNAKTRRNEESVLMKQSTNDQVLNAEINAVAATTTESEAPKQNSKQTRGKKGVTPPSDSGEQTLSQNSSGSAKAQTLPKKRGRKPASSAKPSPEPTPPSPAVKPESETPNSESAPPKASAEPKKSVAKGKKRAFQDELLSYMFVSCKPHTLKSLAQQMNSNESAVNFCMLSLTDKGWVVKKDFTSKGGRSKELYWANQEAKSKELTGSLQMVPPHEIQAKKQELAELQQEERRLAQELAKVTQEPSNEELDSHLHAAQVQLEESEKKLQEALDRIREAEAKASPPSGGKSKKLPSQKRLKTKFNSMRDEWRKRKIKCMDFIEQLADGMEKKVKDVVKLLEIETDEAVGAKMPLKCSID